MASNRIFGFGPSGTVRYGEILTIGGEVRVSGLHKVTNPDQIKVSKDAMAPRPIIHYTVGSPDVFLEGEQTIVVPPGELIQWDAGTCGDCPKEWAYVDEQPAPLAAAA